MSNQKILEALLRIEKQLSRLNYSLIEKSAEPKKTKRPFESSTHFEELSHCVTSFERTNDNEDYLTASEVRDLLIDWGLPGELSLRTTGQFLRHHFADARINKRIKNATHKVYKIKVG